MPDSVTIVEMGPRDGLQNEQAQIDTWDKVRLIDLLSDCGLSLIEAASFVSPKWVPQMADAAEVMGSITRRPGVCYSALTPNLQGFDRALTANADTVAVFGSASEGFSQKNINCSIDASLERFRPLLEAAKTAMMPVRGYVSCVTDCPYDGRVAPENVARVAAAMIKMGCYEVSLGDTIGAGTPDTISEMLDAVLDQVPASRLAGHYHDTGGHALANIEVSLARSLRVFDSSVAGLGGCPYAPGAKGNVATESVVNLLHSIGFHTGIEAGALSLAADFARTLRTSS